MLHKLLMAPQMRSYTGLLSERRKGRHVGQSIQIAGAARTDTLDSITALTSHQLQTISEWTELWTSFIPPLYVGITEDQTLRARLEQHQYNMENVTKESARTLGTRLRAYGLAWSDISVSWIAAGDRQELQALRPLERLLHAITLPVLSHR